MKATGITRKIDPLGRVVIPKEIRRSLAIELGDPVEFYVQGDCIVVKKFDAAGDMEQLFSNFERVLRLKGEMLPPDKLKAALVKMSELKSVINNDTK